jgi:hypothetical protein
VVVLVTPRTIGVNLVWWDGMVCGGVLLIGFCDPMHQLFWARFIQFYTIPTYEVLSKINIIRKHLKDEHTRNPGLR